MTQPHPIDPPQPAPASAGEALLREAERLGNMGSWVWEIGQKPPVWSDQMYRILGLEQGTIQPSTERFVEAVHPEDRDRFRRRVDQTMRGVAGGIEFRIVRPGGEVRHVHSATQVTCDAEGQVVRLTGAITDITERKRLEEHLQHAARIEAVGTLAAGLAHDFNNYLLVIGANLDLLLSTPPDQVPTLLSQARHALDQCAALTGQLLALARKQPSRPGPLDVRVLLERTAGLLRRLIDPHTTLDVVLGDGALGVLADAAHLEQILVNLTVNARDALPHGGTIRFEASRTPAGAGPALADGPPPGLPSPASGSWVRITVADNGRGIAPEHLPRIFEPYFTTKEIGRGTGLGLASVYALVHQNQGDVRVESRPGAGTRFDLWFPAHEVESADVSHPDAAPAPAGRVPGRILVVEDMSSVRAVVVRTLALAGFEVIEAEDGARALELLDGLDDPVDLLLTDVVMPRLGGVELAEAVQGRYPGLPVVFMTGHAEVAPPGAGPALVLGKPFRPTQLLDLVQRTLRASRA